MKLVRAGLYLGLCYSLPVVVWLLGAYGRQPVTGADWSLRVVMALGIVQAMAVVVFAPWCVEQAGWREGPPGIVMLLAVPLPLLAICWLAGAVGATGLLLLQLGLLGLALLLWLVSRLLVALLPGWFRQAAIALLQGLAAVMLWLWREEWLNTLGL